MFSGDAPDQARERIGVRDPEVDPGHGLEEEWEIGLRRGAGEEHGDHRGLTLHEQTQQRVDFLLLPGAFAGAAEADGGTANFFQHTFEVALPGLAGGQLPFIEPGEKSAGFQLLTQLADGGFVGAVVAEENVEFACGALLSELRGQGIWRWVGG